MLHVSKPNIGDTEAFLRRVRNACESGWLSNDGAYVQELEARLAQYIGVRHCVATCNGTIALQLVARALDLRGEIILPAFTFVATPHAFLWEGLTPVFCDIDLATHNIDPDAVEKLITPDTSAIVGVHLWGRGCDVERLADIAARHQLKLVFDASHALGCSHRGRRLGSFGEAEVFSLHATKFINCIEGGLIATNNDDLARKLRSMRNFGFRGYDNVEGLGINAKMNEISAAMGLTNLKSIDEFAAVNRRNYELYNEHLATVRGIELINFPATEQNSCHYVVAMLDASEAGISRDGLIDVLHAHGVLARRYFYPGCHRMEPYRSMSSVRERQLPRTDQVARAVICLPTGMAVTSADVRFVCDVIAAAVSGSDDERVGFAATG